MLSRGTHDLVLAGALISIVLNPFVFKLADRTGGKPPKAQEPAPQPIG